METHELRSHLNTIFAALDAGEISERNTARAVRYVVDHATSEQNYGPTQRAQGREIAERLGLELD